MDQSFGTWIKRRRKSLDLTQQELAKQVGCSASLIFKIEADERRPSRQITGLLAEKLDIPADQRELFHKIARQEKSIVELDKITPLSSPEPGPGPKPFQNNLPRPLTSLIGREYELRAIMQQLQEPACRMLTLVGPGGVGKTRLALEVAHQLYDQFEHGSFFVSLVGTGAPEFILPAIADALGIRFTGTAELKEQLVNWLKEKQILLVLDNMEHLLQGVEIVNGLLEQAPGVKILTTSREQLNLRGEWVFEVHGLPVPSNLQLENSSMNSAAALFIERARRLVNDFSVTSANVTDLERICRLVDGLPLGLELAASWVRVMSINEIAQEIERSKDFLTTSARDVPPRHRSIRAVFDYSWNLLTDDEQRILRQLAIFSGGFTRIAAESVAGVSLSQLSALVDKSLLRQSKSKPGWFDFHELIRQYVELKAQADMDEYIRLQDRHASHYAAWLHQLESRLQGPQQQELLSQISLDIDNIRAAWIWMVANHRTVNLQKSLVGLFVFQDIRNMLYQGLQLFEQAVETLQSNDEEDGNDNRSILIGELKVCQAHMCWHLGQMQKARELLLQSLEKLGDHRDRPMLAEAYLYLSLLEQSQGDFPQARHFAEECVSLNQELDRGFGIGYALSNLGMVCLIQGENETAYAYMKESVALMRSIDHPRGTAVNLTRLGLAALRLGRFAEAQECLEKGIEVTRSLHDRWGYGNALNYLGLLASAKGDLDHAETLIRESVAIFEEDGDQGLLAATRADLGYILYERDLDLEAHQLFLAALQTAIACQALPAAVYALVGVAILYAKNGQVERALELTSFCLQHPSIHWQAKERARQLQTELEPRLPLKQAENDQTRVMTLDACAQKILSGDFMILTG